MAKAKIITEQSVERLKNWVGEFIERYDAELIILSREAQNERDHKQDQNTLNRIAGQHNTIQTKRDIYHYCLCEIQRNITEVEI